LAARATENKTTMQNVSTLFTILMDVVVRQYYTAHIAGWRRFMGFIKSTKRHHRTSTRSNITRSDCLPLILGVYFIVKINKKGLELTLRPQLTIGV
jgi:hypothetical protein